jgi:hypothetical protein
MQPYSKAPWLAEACMVKSPTGTGMPGGSSTSRGLEEVYDVSDDDNEGHGESDVVFGVGAQG